MFLFSYKTIKSTVMSEIEIHDFTQHLSSHLTQITLIFYKSKVQGSTIHNLTLKIKYKVALHYK